MRRWAFEFDGDDLRQLQRDATVWLVYARQDWSNRMAFRSKLYEVRS